MCAFPTYGECEAKKKLDDLRRLLEPDFFASQYINSRGAARLVATCLKSYRASLGSGMWQTDPFLSRLAGEKRVLNLVFACLFDLACNVEYLHGRVTSDKWIYCNRHRGETPQPRAYYSFLKQCPTCCLDHGLEKRLEGAQHKPSSHHIGELTTTIIKLLVWMLGATAESPLEAGLISKQSHDVDAVLYRDDLLVLLEIKASPMATFPIQAVLPRPLTVETGDGPAEQPQHSLVNLDFPAYPLGLYLPHRDLSIPLGAHGTPHWPYPEVSNWFVEPANFLVYFSAWLEIFYAYTVPKTQREGRDVVLGFLANGWGDEIDSNKTKPGLGRTDDIKKGTYQLIKYGAYYRAGCPDLPVRAALVANLDPLFMYLEYLEKLIDIRWAKADRFNKLESPPGHLSIAEKDLYFLYDSVLGFNLPVMNDPLLREAFDFERTNEALLKGQLDPLLDSWISYA